MPVGDGNNTTSSTWKLSIPRREFLAGLGGTVGMAAFGQRTRAKNTSSVQQGGVNEGRAKNAIAFITDGGGLPQITGARYLNAYREDPERFPLNAGPDDMAFGLDRHAAHGTITTFPDDPNEVITDSAAAATSFATGMKTYNGAIGGVRKNDEFSPVETVLEKAQTAGYVTGLVTTTELTHATPAAFASHVPDRGMQQEIARQFIEVSQPDVLLGGQRTDFTADGRDDDRDLLSTATENGYTSVETADELAAVESAPVLGLFTEESHLDYYLDRQHEDGNTQPDLVDMATKAIELLEHASQDSGFFLLVEAGRVDHAGHANDPAVVSEELEAASAAGELIDYVDDPQSKPTFLVSAADHATGGLTLGRDGPYDVEFDVLDGLRASGDRLIRLLDDAESESDIRSILTEWAAIDPTDSEVSELQSDPGAVKAILSERARLGWTTDGHTGTDVPAFAHGPTAQDFDAARDNTDIARALAAALGLTEN